MCRGVGEAGGGRARTKMTTVKLIEIVMMIRW